MSKPPKIVIPGLNRGSGIPGGYVLGRRRGTKQGPAELLNLTQVRAIGIATTTDVTSSTSLVQSIAHSETISLSRSVSSSLSALSGSVSGAVSSVTSLSSAVSSGLSTTNSTNVTQSTSLSLISSSLSGAISSTSSLSTAVSAVDSNQSTSLSQISSSLSGAISSTTSLSATLGTAAVKNTGTSGNTIPLLDGAAATWTNGATFGGDVTTSSGNITAAAAVQATGLAGWTARLQMTGSTLNLQSVLDGTGYSTINLFSGTNGGSLGTQIQVDAVVIAAVNTTGLAVTGNTSTSGVFKIGTSQVVGARKTGWTVDTGTSKRTANATYAAGATLTFTNPPTAAEMSALATRLSAVEAALQDYTQTTKAMKDDLHSTAGHGLIGT